MLAKIAEAIEPYRPGYRVREALKAVVTGKNVTSGDLISLSVEGALERMPISAVVVPSHGGSTARRIARLRLPVWVVAVSSQEATCQALQFSYGVYPVHETDDPEHWTAYTREWVSAQGMSGSLAILIEGPSPRNPDANHKLEIVDLKR
jgi:pyruvate kinase